MYAGSWGSAPNSGAEPQPPRPPWSSPLATPLAKKKMEQKREEQSTSEVKADKKASRDTITSTKSQVKGKLLIKCTENIQLKGELLDMWKENLRLKEELLEKESKPMRQKKSKQDVKMEVEPSQCDEGSSTASRFKDDMDSSKDKTECTMPTANESIINGEVKKLTQRKSETTME